MQLEASFHLGCETDATKRMLLILDGNSSYTLSLVVSFSPQHTSNAVKTFKTLSTSEIAKQLRDKSGQILSTEHIASLGGMAFPRVATMDNCNE